MSNRANIFYDHEIEELVRSRSVELLPMILYMFAQYPHGTVEDIFYTIELHVKDNGLQTFPETLLSVPVPESQEEVVEEVQDFDVEEDLPADSEPLPMDEEPVEEKPAAERERRNIQRRHVTESNDDKLNIRGIMDDLKGIDL